MTPKIFRIFRIFNALPAFLCCVAATLLGSCDNAIYDYEGDCGPHFRVNFVYDYNMKFADAFPHEVRSVTLRLLDDDGNVVWQRTEYGDALSRPGYGMDVDCEPGTYSLHVWAEGEEGLPFSLPGDDAAQFGFLSAWMPRVDGVSGNRLRDLYHGYVSSVTFPDSEGTHVCTVPLTKDTNYIRVVLQQTSDTQLSPEDLEISISDDNGFLNPDNSLREDEVISYRPWSVTPLRADIEDKGMCDGVLAEFSVPRLLETHGPDARLSVRDKEKSIFSVRLIDFLLLVKGNYNRKMENQEYLDRQDVWELTFFLDEGQQWLATHIYINSWRVVLQETDLI